MVIAKVEYLILFYALTDNNVLRNIVCDYNLYVSEVAIAAYKLFHNGDIIASVKAENGKYIDDIVLTMLQIQEHLNNKSLLSYYLTPQIVFF